MSKSCLVYSHPTEPIEIIYDLKNDEAQVLITPENYPYSAVVSLDDIRRLALAILSAEKCEIEDLHDDNRVDYEPDYFVEDNGDVIEVFGITSNGGGDNLGILRDTLLPMAHWILDPLKADPFQIG